VADVQRYFQERAKLAGMSRNQSTATPEQIEKQRAMFQTARRELLLDQHIAALAAGGHELTEEQRNRIRHIFRT